MFLILKELSLQPLGQTFSVRRVQITGCLFNFNLQHGTSFPQNKHFVISIVSTASFKTRYSSLQVFFQIEISTEICTQWVEFLVSREPQLTAPCCLFSPTSILSFCQSLFIIHNHISLLFLSSWTLNAYFFHFEKTCCDRSLVSFSAHTLITNGPICFYSLDTICMVM